MRKLAILTTMAVLIAFAPLATAQSDEGLGVRDLQYFDLANSPYSGPVEVLVNSMHPTVARGSFTDVFVVVQNHSNETTASVAIDLELVYADGVRVRPFHLGAERTQTLGPDQGMGFYIFWQIPSDAPLGSGHFAVRAIVGRLSGGDDSHADNTNPMVAEDSVNFDVVP